MYLSLNCALDAEKLKATQREEKQGRGLTSLKIGTEYNLASEDTDPINCKTTIQKHRYQKFKTL